MNRLQIFTLSLSVVLLACSATAYITHTRFRFSQDDTWHAGFWTGHKTCWEFHQANAGQSQ